MFALAGARAVVAVEWKEFLAIADALTCAALARKIGQTSIGHTREPRWISVARR